MIGDRLIFFAQPLQRSNLCASHRQRRWLTYLSYGVDGRQYIAITTGNNFKVPGELSLMAPDITVPSAHTAIYAFALP